MMFYPVVLVLMDKNSIVLGFETIIAYMALTI